MSELDNLLDLTLDDLDDLPSFEPYPAGAHKLLATFEPKKIGEKDAIELSFKYVELLELANPEDKTPKEGDTCNTMFLIGNEFGLGNLKKCATPFADMVGSNNLRAIIDGVKDVECAVVTSIRVDKNDASKRYLQVKEIVVM